MAVSPEILKRIQEALKPKKPPAKAEARVVVQTAKPESAKPSRKRERSRDLRRLVEEQRTQWLKALSGIKFAPGSEAEQRFVTVIKEVENIGNELGDKDKKDAALAAARGLVEEAKVAKDKGEQAQVATEYIAYSAAALAQTPAERKAYYTVLEDLRGSVPRVSERVDVDTYAASRLGEAVAEGRLEEADVKPVLQQLTKAEPTAPATFTASRSLAESFIELESAHPVRVHELEALKSALLERDPEAVESIMVNIGRDFTHKEQAKIHKHTNDLVVVTPHIPQAEELKKAVLSGPEAEPKAAAEGIIFTEDEVEAFAKRYERLARKLRGIEVYLRSDPTKINDPDWLRKMEDQVLETTQDMTPDQAVKALGERGPTDKSEREVWLKNIVMENPLVKSAPEAIARQAVERVKQRKDELAHATPELARQQLEKIEALGRIIGREEQVIGEIKFRFAKQAADGGTPMPDSVQSLFTDIEAVRAGGVYEVVGTQIDTVTGQEIVVTEEKKFDLQKRRELVLGLRQKLRDIGAAVLPEKGRLESLVQHLDERLDLEEANGRLSYDRLAQAGLEPGGKEWFDLIANPHKFLTALTTLEYKGERFKDVQEFMENVEKRTKDVAKQFLAAVDSDDYQFMSELFTSLIHEPFYNDYVANLETLINRISEMEQAGQVTRVTREVWDRKLRREVLQKDAQGNESITLSQYLRQIKDWVREEKVRKRLTHDGYVLYLTHNFEYFSKMANSIEMASLDSLFAEEGKMLDVALAAYDGYAQKEYGMNYYMAPEGVFTRNERGIIPADEHAAQVLRQQFTKEELSERDLKRLVKLARGAAHVMTGEVPDLTTSSDGPKADAHGRQLTEHYGNTAHNMLNTMKRFLMDVPFLKHAFMYVPIGQKHSFLRPRWVPTEIKKAEKLTELRANRGRSRFFTFDEFENKGVCLMDSFEGLLQTGFWGNRGYRWRGEQAYMHLYVQKGSDVAGSYNSEQPNTKAIKANLDFEKTVRNLMVANPQAAMSIMEMWHGRGLIEQSDLFTLREMVWQRLRAVAPQSFVVLERDMLDHNKLGKWKNMDEAALSQIILDAETITRNILNRTTADSAPTLAVLQNDEDWRNALTPNVEARYAGFETRVQNAREFMETLRDQAVDDMIQGNRGAWSDTDYASQVKALKKISFTRTMPAHYRSYVREMNFAATGNRTIGRLVGDSDTMGAAFKEIVLGELKQVVLDMQGDPEKVKDAKYRTVVAVIRKYADAVQSVHGTESKEDKIAAVYHAAYILDSAFVGWFNKGTLSRALGSVDPRLLDISSWVNYATGQKDAEMDASEIRTLANQSVSQNIIAPYHGGAVEVKQVDLGLFKVDLGLPIVKTVNLGPIKIPVGFKRTPYNATRFVTEHGALRLHLAFDIVRSYAPLFVILLLLAAWQQGLKDQEER